MINIKSQTESGYNIKHKTGENMSKLVFGQLDSWDSAPSTGTSKDDYLNTKTDGLYTMRVLTEPPYMYHPHWYEYAPGKKTKINCASKDCMLCKEGNEATATFVSIVFNKDLNRPQIYEFKRQVLNGIKSLHSKKAWGSLLNYDIVVERTSPKGKTSYSVSPEPKEPLTAGQLAMVEEFKNRISLDDFCAVSTNEAIVKRLADARERLAEGGGNSFKSNTKLEPQSPPLEDVDFNFAAP